MDGWLDGWRVVDILDGWRDGEIDEWRGGEREIVGEMDGEVVGEVEREMDEEKRAKTGLVLQRAVQKQMGEIGMRHTREVRSVIKFLNAQSVAPIEIDRQLCQDYAPNVMSKQMVRCSTRSPGTPDDQFQSALCPVHSKTLSLTALHAAGAGIGTSIFNQCNEATGTESTRKFLLAHAPCQDITLSQASQLMPTGASARYRAQESLSALQRKGKRQTKEVVYAAWSSYIQGWPSLIQ
ncbi:hypothetical protein ANN_00796 [Periplaneta americana]|uniref:Uncharacterized protein n=1 Tax=Periplaneta americana TaxID=6978 RepID=A0ABQ8TRU8_PERAM|nr:hypothetical protein ANN_00796 [Periplaneta americana]